MKNVQNTCFAPLKSGANVTPPNACESGQKWEAPEFDPLSKVGKKWVVKKDCPLSERANASNKRATTRAGRRGDFGLKGAPKGNSSSGKRWRKIARAYIEQRTALSPDLRASDVFSANEVLHLNALITATLALEQLYADLTSGRPIDWPRYECLTDHALGHLAVLGLRPVSNPLQQCHVHKEARRALRKAVAHDPLTPRPVQPPIPPTLDEILRGVP